MKKRNKFKMPSKNDILARSGHMNNAILQSAFPPVYPSQDKIEEMYAKLNLQPNHCVYCDKDITDEIHVDHLHPLQGNDKTKVFPTDITNLLPCCEQCNNKKSNKSFDEWYKSDETKKYLILHRKMSEDLYNDRYKRIIDYHKNSNSLRISDELNQRKEYLIFIKNKFNEMLHLMSIDWGNMVYKDNNKQIPDENIKKKMTTKQKKCWEKICKEISSVYEFDEHIKNIMSKENSRRSKEDDPICTLW